MPFADALASQGSGLKVTIGAAAIAWQSYQVARAPRNPRRWMVLGAFVAQTINFARWPEATEWYKALLGPGGPSIIGYATSMIVYYFLVAFFLHAANQMTGLRRHTWLFLVVLAASLFMAGLGAAGRPALPSRLVGLLYTWEYGLYVNSMAVVATVLAVRYARRCRPPLSHGLYLLAIGVAGRAVAGFVGNVLNEQLTALGHPLPHQLVADAYAAMNLAQLLCLTGLIYPGTMARIDAIRRWHNQRRTYRAMGPLWTALHGAFPETLLRPSPTASLSDRLAWRSAQRRCYRRLLECRDGLVRISPYLPAHPGGPPADPARQADDLRTALAAHANGAPATSGPISRLADPADAGIDADARALVDLSRALHGTSG